MDDIAESSTALVTLTALVPAVVFAEGGVDALLDKLRREVRAIKIDISTPKGRAECASVAYKVARSKTALDSMGKTLGEDHYKQWKAITAERAKIETALDALKDEVRKPLTDWENAEKDRVAAHESALAVLSGMGVLDVPLAANDIKAQLDSVPTLYARDWQEFEKRAGDAHELALSRLIKAYETAVKSEHDAAEAARIAAETAERERREREDRIAALAAAQAKREAEEKAASEARAAAEKARIEQERLAAEKTAAEARARKAEEDRIAAEAQYKLNVEAAAKRAEAEKKAAAEKAIRDQELARELAIETERERVADTAAAEAAETARREADKKHRGKVNGDALAALIKFAALTEDQAKAIVTAIVRHEIPHVSISY